MSILDHIKDPVGLLGQDVCGRLSVFKHTGAVGPWNAAGLSRYEWEDANKDSVSGVSFGGVDLGGFPGGSESETLASNDDAEFDAWLAAYGPFGGELSLADIHYRITRLPNFSYDIRLVAGLINRGLLPLSA